MIRVFAIGLIIAAAPYLLGIGGRSIGNPHYFLETVLTNSIAGLIVYSAVRAAIARHYIVIAIVAFMAFVFNLGVLIPAVDSLVLAFKNRFFTSLPFFTSYRGLLFDRLSLVWRLFLNDPLQAFKNSELALSAMVMIGLALSKSRNSDQRGIPSNASSVEGPYRIRTPLRLWLPIASLLVLACGILILLPIPPFTLFIFLPIKMFPFVFVFLAPFLIPNLFYAAWKLNRIRNQAFKTRRKFSKLVLIDAIALNTASAIIFFPVILLFTRSNENQELFFLLVFFISSIGTCLGCVIFSFIILKRTPETATPGSDPP